MNGKDEELIRLLLSEVPAIRQKAWENLYKICYPLIKEMVVKNNGSEDDAWDVFQDGLVVLNNNLKNGAYRHDSALNTYVFGICRNLWLHEFNRRHRQSIAEKEMAISTQDFDYLINVEIVTLLMNELEKDCRDILTEYYFNKKTMAELKDLFNVNSIQAAKNKKWRCMNYLTKLFKEKGVKPTWN